MKNKTSIRVFCSLVLLILTVILIGGCKKSLEEDPIKTISIELSKERIGIKDVYGISFPRLGMWWLNAYEETAKDIARYDLLLNEFDDEVLLDKLEEVRNLNPNQILLRPISPSEQFLFEDEEETIGNRSIVNLPTAFFLVYQGAKLTEPVDMEDTHLYVDRLEDEEGYPLFYIGEDIAIGDYESAKIINIDQEAKSIEVIRGYVRGTVFHEVSELVSVHVRFWPGTWVMNITSACPWISISGIDEPVDYIHYFHLLTQNKVEDIYEASWENPYFINQEGAAYDGFVIDRFEDHQSWLRWLGEEVRQLDPYVNQSVLSNENFDHLVMKTVDAYTNLLRETYGDCIIIRNNPLTVRQSLHDGQVYESSGWEVPSFSQWKRLFIGLSEEELEYEEYEVSSYLQWFENEENPLVMMEVYEDEKGADSDGDGEYNNPLSNPLYQVHDKRMGLSLCSTLLGDGFYSYEVNTNGHGDLGLLWFDAYDLGENDKGYLGFPIGQYYEIEKNIFIREYEKGLVVVNVSDSNVRLEFDKKISVANGFKYDKIEGLGSFEGGIFLLDEQE